MAEIINLRQARKRKQRADAAATAAANRAAFGRTKSDKALATAETIRRSRLLDGSLLEPDPSDDR
jgi:hypothetical protein